MQALLFITSIVILPAVAQAQEDDSQWLENCRSMRWHNDRPTACDVRVRTIPARSRLAVRPGQNGAVHIIGYDGSGIEVHTRLQASDESRAAAEDLLEKNRHRPGANHPGRRT